MKIDLNELNNKPSPNQQTTKSKEDSWKNELFYNHFKKNVQDSNRDSYEKSNTKLVESLISNYEYYNIQTTNRIKENGQIEMSAVIETGVRNLTYAQSDKIHVNVLEGYTYRAKVDVSSHKVYLEYHNDEGEIKAYVADVPSIAKNTENPMEQLALASWNEVLEKNRQELGFTQYKAPILAGMTIPGKYVNGCFISELTTYEDTIYFGKFGDACGMADIFGGSWSDYYSMDESEPHPESVSIKLFTGRTVVVDINRSSQISQLQGVLSQAEYAQLTDALEDEVGSIRMPQEKWDKLLKWTDEAIEAFKKQTQEKIEVQEKELLEQKRLEKNVPYGHLANEDGVIIYNGVVFNCDEETNSICLGDMSNPTEVLTIPLSEGGCLKVNRDNYGDLVNAILMFSPEDRNRIMRAIAQDKKVQEIRKQIEDEKAHAVQNTNHL